MTFDQAVRATRSHIERQFPRTCPSCGRSFATPADYVRATRPLGNPISYDAEAGDWAPRDPLGVFAMANCTCGTTLAITSDGMSMWTLWRLMAWARKETRRRAISMQELLGDIRAEIDRQILARSDPVARPPRDSDATR